MVAVREVGSGQAKESLDACSDDLEYGEVDSRRHHGASHGGWELHMDETSEVIWAEVTIRVKRIVAHAA
jgi:hypothetical protein